MKKINKKASIGILVCLLCAFFALFSFAGCDGGTTPPGPEKPSRYTVTVHSGSGGGEFKPGKECVVTATVPEGKMFARWTVGGETVSTENPYTFTVTENVEITAVVGTPYTLTVEGGKIGDTTEMEARIVGGETVSVKARSTTAKTFLYWLVGDSEKHITDNPYSFALTGDTLVRAVFDETFLISVADGTVFATGKPEDAARSMRVKAGDSCTIRANDAPAGQKFAYWYYLDENRKEVKIADNAEYTFEASHSRKIYAKYDFYFTVNVENGYIGDDTGASTAEIWENEEITVTAVIPEGKGFAYWEVGGEQVSTFYQYTFKVTEDVTLRAVFADSITLATPKNDANQMFTKKPSSYSDMIVELDRQKDEGGNRKTVFVEGVDYVVYYLYTSTAADKDDYVGTFRMLQTNDTSAEIQTMDGSRKIGVGSTPGDYYFDRVSNADFFAFIRAAVGDGYSDTQAYYVAAQVKGLENSIYVDSGISEIGTSAIQEKTA